MIDTINIIKKKSPHVQYLCISPKYVCDSLGTNKALNQSVF
jgi:hypothetical protein